MPTQARTFLAWSCALMLACVLPLRWLGVDILIPSITTALAFLSATAGALFILVYLDKAPLVRLLLEVTGWSILIGLLSNLPLALVVRLPVPVVDSYASALDARLGIHAQNWVRFAQRHPRVDWALNLVYISLRPANMLALYVPILCRKARWSSELFIALVLQLLATVSIMSVAQGIGPWLVDGVNASARQLEIGELMTRFKSARHIGLDMGDIPGFVAFPSWHVMLALLAATTIGRIRVLRAACIAWVGLIAISTLTTGWHYGVDVISGLVVGTLCIFASRRIHCHWDSQHRQAARVPPLPDGQGCQ